MLIELIISGQLTLDDVEMGITYLNSHYIDLYSINSKDDWLLWKDVLDKNKPKTNTKYDELYIISIIGSQYEDQKNRKTGDKSDPSDYIFKGQGDSMMRGAYV